MENHPDPRLLSAHSSTENLAKRTSLELDDNQSNISDQYATSVTSATVPGLFRSLSQGHVPEYIVPRQRERTSWIWKHGSLYQAPDRNGILKNRWRCSLCPDPKTAVTYADTTTKNSIHHLIKCHGFYDNGERVHIAEFVGRNTGTSSQILHDSFHNNLAQSIPRLIFNEDVFKHLFLRWIIVNNISFSQAVSPVLRFLLMYLGAVQASFTDLGKALPKSSSTIGSWVMKSFTENRDRIKIFLSNSISSIHLSFDLWTSPNNLSLMGIVGHWLDEQGTLRHGLLALRRLFGLHSGENQAELVWGVITEFQIQNTTGYFTLDNASNNITALRFLQQKLITFQQKSPSSSSPTVNTDSKLVRCYGHVLNLVVKVFLYGKKSSVLISKEEKKNVERENEEMDRWRKLGPFGKLRNITVWIHGSTQQRDAFCRTTSEHTGDITRARTLILGNVTRWTGDYDGLERALLLRQAITLHLNKILQEDHNSVLAKDYLTPPDWYFLEQMIEFLRPFRVQTLALEGHRKQGSLYDVYPSLEILTRHIQHTRRKLTGQSPYLDLSLMLAAEKMAKYYSLESLSPIICASIVLHPGMDNFFEDFEEGWGDGRAIEWGGKAKMLVQNLWQKYYKNLPLHEVSEASPFSPKRTLNPAVIPSSSTNSQRNFKKPKLNRNLQQDELKKYLSWLNTNDSDDPVPFPIKWWLERRKLYPRLSILALDAFSIPAMSAECERVFSSAKQLVTDRQNLLSEETIEAGECQKSWARAELISFNSAGDISELLRVGERDSLTLEKMA